MDAFNANEKRECANHGPYQARVIQVAGRTIVSPCPGCSAEQQAKEADRDRKQQEDAKRRRIEMLTQRAGIPPRFQASSFDNYTTQNEGQAKALHTARSYAEDWPERLRKGTCLIFSGKPGTGKTHLAIAIAHAVLAAGHSAQFITISDAMRSIKQTYGKEAVRSEADAIQELIEPRLLILDECGMDYGTDHSKTLIFDVLNKRYEQIRPTIILTNLDAPALREYFGDRIMDRLRDGGGRLTSFTWESGRE